MLPVWFLITANISTSFLSGQETQISEEDYRAVLALGNRCGFTDGYYHRHNGSDMVTFTKPNYEKIE